MTYDFIIQVGDSYGRKMLKGYIQGSKNIRISERRLRRLMPIISRNGHSSRQMSAYELRNPSIYVARYFGHKLHMDQNEKLSVFGVTCVIARDGYSGMIVASAVMPKKNNILIYEHVYRSAVLNNGLWDQIRVDHGREFYLTLFIHERLRQNRGNSEISPYVQTTSTQNHIIERIWVELNRRVIYPIKRAIVEIQEIATINMNCPVTMFAVSNVLMQVTEVGMNRMIISWNSHFIPRRGVPNILRSTRFGTTSIDSHVLPSVRSAVSMYTDQGGHLSDPSCVGSDPLQGDVALMQQRESEWLSACDASDLFSDVLLGNISSLNDAIQLYVTLTLRLSP